MSEDLIYMDHAATTPLCEEAIDAMRKVMEENYGNPSSIHPAGRKARRLLDAARADIASVIGAKENEIYFTGSGSEADSWAFFNAAETLGTKGRHIITTSIEHHAILRSGEYLERHGFDVTYLDVDADGRVSPEAVERAIRPDTILISVMTANNEVGTVQPVREIGKIAHEHGILFHTDAVQAFAHVPIDVDTDHIDMLSASAHKINAPKGVGFLYVRNTVVLRSLIHGGQQERGKRGGTENTVGIAGFAAAAKAAAGEMAVRAGYTERLQDHMIGRILGEVPLTALNGPDPRAGGCRRTGREGRPERLAGNVNIRFKYVDGESLLLSLSERGICCSAGSACDSGSVQPSHVILALGVPYEDAFGSIRFSLSHRNTMEEVDEVCDALPGIVAELRKSSPEYMEMVSGKE